MTNRSQSELLFEQARRLFPGGVNSPVRAFQAVGGTPVFFRSGRGARLTDLDGNEYLDFVGSWGPLILGHARPEVTAAIIEAAGRGTSFGAPSPLETDLAERVREAFPHLERMRFVSSGTEAVMGAIRLARAYTGRDLILKFSGCYHGHADSLLVKAGSGAATLGTPSSPGVPKALAELTLTAAYNDLAEVEDLAAAHPGRIACLIVEPVAGNMGCVPPQPGFLSGLRELCDRQGIVLILDEVMTGFRVAFGGAQELFGVRGDLVCLGKIIGGGMPVGAFGGRKEIMSILAPEGSVYQAGTLSGNPVAMAAGIATLKLLQERNFYPRLEQKGRRLEQGLRPILAHYPERLCFQRVGSMFCLYFRSAPVRSFEEAARSDTAAFSRFFHLMLDQGCYLPPAQFESCFLSAAHTMEDLDAFLDAAGHSLKIVFG
ncbi:MAG: glutamate-1-semialdehyde 2,1-aminomutase [Deltaproteobacteria bacterium]|nr:glutamate-1-semialdehyde 2,1-aminomutase [Deltaproteobacteria bacterium]